MNKQMTVVDLAIVYAAVIVTIIILSAVQKLNSPTSHANGSSSPVVKEGSAEFAASSVGVEGTDQYSAVVFDPAIGAEIVEWNAPRRVSSVEANVADSEGAGQNSTVVFNPGTGMAEAVEYSAPRVK